jgi:phosphotriesterase-related protein
VAQFVNTVTGPVPVESLGRTLVHEHLLIGYPGWHLDALAPRFDRDRAMGRALEWMRKLLDHGVRTFVDPCPMDLGRDVRFMAEVSERSGMQIVCTTGMYTEAQGLTYTFKNLPLEDVAAIFTKELTEGIADSGIRAGAIKCATGLGVISDYERHMLTAATRASIATGAPIITHTEDGTCGPEQLELFVSHGLIPHHALIGHTDGLDDPATHRRIVDGGAYIGFDRLGLESLMPDATRVKNIARLVQAGFGDRICLSHDYQCAGWLGRPVFGPGRVLNDPDLVGRSLPNWNPLHLFTRIVPMLREAGVSEVSITQMLDENPTRWFRGTPPPSAL